MILAQSGSSGLGYFYSNCSSGSSGIEAIVRAAGGGAVATAGVQQEVAAIVAATTPGSGCSKADGLPRRYELLQ